MTWLRASARRLGFPWALSSGRTGYAVAPLGIAVTVAVLAPTRAWLGLLNIGLLFLVLVVLIAARWGWGPGLLASIGANLAFNFFFVPPLYRFRVQEPVNVVELLVFLILASLTSALLARAKAGESAARRREQEITILYDLSRLVIIEPDMNTTLVTIGDRVRQIFGAKVCVVLLPGPDGLSPTAWSAPQQPAAATMFERRAAWEAFTRGETVALTDRGDRRRPRLVDGIARRGRPAPALFVPLRVVGQTVGVLQLVGRLAATVFTADELRLLDAFADEAALAVDRGRLLHEAASAEALVETDRMKTVLLSAVSHDLRTPLATILTSISSLLQPDVSWDEETRHEFLSGIESQTRRLMRLVSNLLDLTRIEAGAVRPETGWFAVEELLHSVVETMTPALGGRQITLAVAQDVGDVPFDYVQLSQVLTNLLENAAKFAPRGSPIELGARRIGGVVHITVADHGPGLPPAERERVFETFFRAGGVSRHVTGTGLGLAICKGFVEANGGSIHVEATAGGGATFVVVLPAPAPSVLRSMLSGAARVERLG